MINWAGKFGDDYTERNSTIVDRQPFFQKLGRYPIEYALEIGCNIGLNMMAIEAATDIQTQGCDINEKALSIAREGNLKVETASGLDLPYGDKEFDLVFTVGVLIHMSTQDMITMMYEMERVSSKFILMGEYEGNDTEIEYRGHRGALVKRQYGRIWKSLFPWSQHMWKDMVLDGFDTVTFWMYDIRDSSSEDAVYTFSGEGIDTDRRKADDNASIAEIAKERLS